MRNRAKIKSRKLENITTYATNKACPKTSTEANYASKVTIQAC